jgi:hypothetical protein
MILHLICTKNIRKEKIEKKEPRENQNRTTPFTSRLPKLKVYTCGN